MADIGGGCTDIAVFIDGAIQHTATLPLGGNHITRDLVVGLRSPYHAAEEAKALLAQAETDVQRARAKRALWLKAWEDLVTARQAAVAKDHARASRHARRASELAQLGLEQLAYPAVR